MGFTLYMYSVFNIAQFRYQVTYTKARMMISVLASSNDMFRNHPIKPSI